MEKLLPFEQKIIFFSHTAFQLQLPLLLLLSVSPPLSLPSGSTPFLPLIKKKRASKS